MQRTIHYHIVQESYERDDAKLGLHGFTALHASVANVEFLTKP